MSTTPEKLVEDFFSKYTKITYKKGEIILRADDPPAGAQYIKSGFVRQSFVSQSGEVLVLHIFKPGAFFPMTWIINDTSNRYYYEALTPVEIYRTPGGDLKKFLADTPRVTTHFMSRILFGVSGLLERMEHLVLASAYHKTVLLLLYYVKQFKDEKVKGKLKIPLTHKEIASWIGTTRETASLQIEALKKKGLISYDRRSIIIPDIAALSREASETESKQE